MPLGVSSGAFAACACVHVMSLMPSAVVRLVVLLSLCSPDPKPLLTSSTVVPESRCRRAALVLELGTSSVTVTLMGPLLRSGYLMGRVPPKTTMVVSPMVLAP